MAAVIRYRSIMPGSGDPLSLDHTWQKLWPICHSNPALISAAHVDDHLKSCLLGKANEQPRDVAMCEQRLATTRATSNLAMCEQRLATCCSECIFESNNIM
jgi:hypothetical protein